MLPEALRHHAAGRPIQGMGRDARGLLLRGVVVGVEFPAEHVAGDIDPARLPGVLCSVLIYQAQQRTVLHGVPVAVQSGGYGDHEVWVPQAATRNVVGGAFDVMRADVTELDGDHVLVGFIAGDFAQPVLLSQLPHPRTTERPTDTAVRYDRVLAGTRVQVFEDGEVVVTPAGKVTITNGAAPAPEPVILGRTFLTDLVAALVEIQTLMVGLGVPTTDLAVLITDINASLASTAPYLSSLLETD